MEKLYLVEYYTLEPGTNNGGWEIRFAWVSANSYKEAKEKMKRVPEFDEIITISEQGSRVVLPYPNKIDTSIFVS